MINFLLLFIIRLFITICITIQLLIAISPIFLYNYFKIANWFVLASILLYYFIFTKRADEGRWYSSFFIFKWYFDIVATIEQKYCRFFGLRTVLYKDINKKKKKKLSGKAKQKKRKK